MINFITNMQTAAQSVANSNTPRNMIDQWISEQGEDFEDAEGFLGSYRVTNVNTGASVESTGLDAPLSDGQTLSIYTKAVATGGVKGASC